MEIELPPPYCQIGTCIIKARLDFFKKRITLNKKSQEGGKEDIARSVVTSSVGGSGREGKEGQRVKGLNST